METSEKRIRIKPRKLARSMARAMLDKQGATGYNKAPVFKGKRTRSRFSRSWKELALQARKEAAAREGAKKSKIPQRGAGRRKAVMS